MPYLYLTVDFKLNENTAIQCHFKSPLREEIFWWLVGSKGMLKGFFCFVLIPVSSLCLSGYAVVKQSILADSPTKTSPQSQNQSVDKM